MKKLLLLITSVIIIQIAFAQADLICSSVTCNQNSIPNGNYLYLTFKVKNQGTTVAAKTHSAIWLVDSASNTDNLLSSVSTESIKANDSSSLYNFVFPMPFNLGTGSKYIAIVVNSLSEISESNTSNNTTYLNHTIKIPASGLASENLPYPIIFVHGLNSSDETWFQYIDSIQKSYGLSWGGSLNFCLNQDGDSTKSNINNDVKDWTDTTQLYKGDYYTVNFDVDRYGNLYPTNTLVGNQSAIVKQGWAIQQAINHVLKVTGRDPRRYDK